MRYLASITLGYLVAAWAVVALFTLCGLEPAGYRAILSAPLKLLYILFRDVLTTMAPVDWAPTGLEYALVFVVFPLTWLAASIAIARLIRSSPGSHAG